ncbi:dethiobiotin synthetase [Kibdelosporangium banguiense]|uniref:ATP-dependent dethiobiotin synthetase BioD n=1 Tax=Kibdelosporangium banguiense TaxID=1365924 RepID=A0ABS4TJ67_9PSEU|nr:dethiobiotin synthase [Kibdelosporangium banguiense]MBP2324054.1 dethiobiotin synthetase [Kibdelosporangium banguiense]
MSVIVVTGTGTGVGKTIVTSAIAAIAQSDGRRVAVIKAAQAGLHEDGTGDLDTVRRLAGAVTTRELARYLDPLAPETAARRSGLPTVGPADIAAAASQLDETHDLVIIEGAGGLLVRFDGNGSTIADAAWAMGVPMLMVAQASLGTLNATALTAEVLLKRGIESLGVVIGSWPAEPDLAARCNLEDLPVAAGAPLLGAIPEGAGQLNPAQFLESARAGLSPWFGGDFDPEQFAMTYKSG